MPLPSFNVAVWEVIVKKLLYMHMERIHETRRMHDLWAHRFGQLRRHERLTIAFDIIKLSYISAHTFHLDMRFMPRNFLAHLLPVPVDDWMDDGLVGRELTVARFFAWSFAGVSWASSTRFLRMEDRAFRLFVRYFGCVYFTNLRQMQAFADATALMQRPFDAPGQHIPDDDDDMLMPARRPLLQERPLEEDEAQPLELMSLQTRDFRLGVLALPRELDDFSRLHRALGYPLCNELVVLVTEPMPRLRLRNITNLVIHAQASIDAVDFENIEHIHWHVSHDQRHIEGTIRFVDTVVIAPNTAQQGPRANNAGRGPVQFAIPALENVQQVHIKDLDNTVIDLQPLAHAHDVILENVDVITLAPLFDVKGSLFLRTVSAQHPTDSYAVFQCRYLNLLNVDCVRDHPAFPLASHVWILACDEMRSVGIDFDTIQVLYNWHCAHMANTLRTYHRRAPAH
ncbi:hypothetical protein PTSG_04232 [Salpingoeca rosetta]|uniref:Uncharacterized protein n=1 Tax=Salpingoeca rosetta (strain ATCC 50818 / BSB-021) TaxID=946362 RepID=F2U6Z2_SALR5|nr:uncharacterized protein PTSG_04232 [Salpingoeca rosetta]EGD83624.1 hypothetical protein PTSG_04232 [Salpingoeca rosetta]|eukprot:XP_004995128.1 hypothetical protein PTSG_04232 [Salpingoeca rosetta]